MSKDSDKDTLLPLERWPDKTRKVPYGSVKLGFIVDPNDPYHIIPHPETIYWLEKGFDYLEAGSSLREVCEWLCQKLSRDNMVHQTLANSYNEFRKPYVRTKTHKRKLPSPSKETRKVIAAKVSAHYAQKNAERIAKEHELSKRRLKTEDYDTPPVPVEPKTKPFLLRDDNPDNKAPRILFRANPGPQSDFLSATELEILYGGGAGSGKSYAMLADPMRYFSNPNFVGLLLRRTNDELKELIRKSRELYPEAFPGAEFKIKESMWKFPSGAEFWMTYLDRDDDVYRYQGQSFCWIGVDELTQYATPFAWNYLASRLRTTDPELRRHLSMRACVDEGEVLTSTGWKDIKCVKEGEFVYSLTLDGTLVLRRVHSSVSYNVEEKLVRIRKKNLYMSMTPDHRVVYKSNQNSKNYSIDKWNEIPNKSVELSRSAENYDSVGWEGPVSPEFLGWYIAEGSFGKPRNGNYKVIVTQNKTKNHAEVRNVMESTGFKVCYSKNGDFQITNKSLWEYVSQFGKSYDKHFPRDFLVTANYDQLNRAFLAYAKGDGHWQTDTSCSLTTTSVQLVDDLCEIGVKLGYKTQVKIYPSTNTNHRDKYVVYFTLGNTTKIDKNPNDRDDQSFEDYKGKVYCLGVEETENFVIRQKGYVWISGNTTNPGGPGHSWVKKMFIDPAVPGQAFWATDIDSGEILRYPPNHHNPDKAGKPLFKRRFIPALMKDNPYLYEDGTYEMRLLSLPEYERRQLLEGDWSIVAGAAFAEFNPTIHVCKPFDIPTSWKRFRAGDFGYSSHSAVLWFAIDPSYETLYVYDELYVSKKTGIQLADLIKEKEGPARVSYGVLDSAVWAQPGHTGLNGYLGPSIAEEMISRGVSWRKADKGQGSRVAGKNRLHELLRVDPDTNRPGIIFFETCRQIIADLPSIPTDPDGGDDIDDRFQSDHTYDALRYGIMSRPRAGTSLDWGRKPVHSAPPPFDPIFGY